MNLHIDLETYSSVDIKKSGAYKYFESIDFEILMMAYCFEEEEVQVVSLAEGEKIPQRVIDAFKNPKVIKKAHNANFERNALKTIGYDIPINQWECSAVKAAYCGLPISLEKVSEVLNLGDKSKLKIGKELISIFSVPNKKRNSRNFYFDYSDKWELFKEYCKMDVEAEREISRILSVYPFPVSERENYILDQEINDRGILVDVDLAIKAKKIDDEHVKSIIDRFVSLTGIENPKSSQQIGDWLLLNMDVSEDLLSEKTKSVSLKKENIAKMIGETDSVIIKKALELKKKISKTSTAKYLAMINSHCSDNRVRGMFQFYGAFRTGRWAGRIVQLQNLPQNHLKNLDFDRETIKTCDYDLISVMYDDVSDVLSQLIRTAFIAPDEATFAVADFSAIEARVIAWLANEKWRLEVFATHGKIYEASASMMFNVPIENIKKGSDLRDKGKVAELALGYQGSLGALKNMGGAKMGLSDPEMTQIVKVWRAKNKNIVRLWDEVNNAAIHTVKTKKPVVLRNFRNLMFNFDGTALSIKLPSGRCLFYREAQISENKFGSEAVRYKSVGDKGGWDWTDTYGGKLVENIVQAIARDLLAYSMNQLKQASFNIVIHVHDEVVAEIPEKDCEKHLESMCEIMGREVPWAVGLPLKADGYVTKYYKKD